MVAREGEGERKDLSSSSSSYPPLSCLLGTVQSTLNKVSKLDIMNLHSTSKDMLYYTLVPYILFQQTEVGTMLVLSRVNCTSFSFSCVQDGEKSSFFQRGEREHEEGEEG